MHLPAVLFGFLIATLFGAAFHVWKGGGVGRLILYVVLSWIGFWAGHLLGNYMGLVFFSVGPIRFGMAVLGCFGLLWGGHWLSLVDTDKEEEKV